MGGGVSKNSTKLSKPDDCNQDIWDKILRLYDRLDINGDNTLENEELIRISELHVKNLKNKIEQLLENIPYVRDLEIEKIKKETALKIKNLNEDSSKKIENIKCELNELNELTKEQKAIKMKKAIKGNKTDIEFWDFYNYMKTRTNDIPNIQW
tara:strand:- start:74 stop:532 length:459 start_codon:yes stop_codon:yes gene_type:complete